MYTPLVMRVFVILPAAGIGTRMAAGGTSTVAPKQFLEVGGVPVLVRSVRAFLAVPRVDAVCVAVRAQERERVEAQMLEYNLGARVHMVEGGDHRQQSVGNALAALECDEDDVVLVHDAVRPLIDPATIERTMFRRRRRRGLCLVCCEGRLWRRRRMSFPGPMRLVCWNGRGSRFGWFRGRPGILRLLSRGILSWRSFIWVRRKA